MQRINYTYAGLDLGQRNDYSTIAVLDLVEEISNQRNPVNYEFITRRILHLRGLHRFPLGTPYTEIPSLVRSAIVTPPVGHFGALPKTTLAIDAGGPGLPVIELVRQAKVPCNILPAMITGGAMGNYLAGSIYSVPRRDLVTHLRTALENQVLVFPQDLPMREALKQELLNIESAGGQSKHDDMAIAIALALWATTIRMPSLLGNLAA